MKESLFLVCCYLLLLKCSGESEAQIAILVDLSLLYGIDVTFVI